MELETTTLLDGLRFPECPRWHDGRLWFSDLGTSEVLAVDLDGNVETILPVPTVASGLGWLPDGRLLVVSMRDRRVLRLDPDRLVTVAHMRRKASLFLKDLVVDRQGRAYTVNTGFTPAPSDSHYKPATILLVKPNGKTRVVANKLISPTGVVITPDGETLIVIEACAWRLTAFDIEPDGTLTRPRMWADIRRIPQPCSICQDAEGSIWVASPYSWEVIRVREGGGMASESQGVGVALGLHTGWDR